MPDVRLYLAITLDGFIADREGGVDWLAPYETDDVGFDRFFAQIGAIITGRTTYDQARSFNAWPYAGRTMHVLTSRPLEDDAPAGVHMAAGDPAELVARLKAETDGDIWLLGGSVTAGMFLTRDLVDRLELYVVPELLGQGVRLFPVPGPRRTLTLTSTRAFASGLVELVYERAS